MKASTIIRWVITILLLVFVWMGKLWAIALAITLLTVAMECVSYLLKRKEKRDVDKNKEKV